MLKQESEHTNEAEGSKPAREHILFVKFRMHSPVEIIYTVLKKNGVYVYVAIHKDGQS